MGELHVPLAESRLILDGIRDTTDDERLLARVFLARCDADDVAPLLGLPT